MGLRGRFDKSSVLMSLHCETAAAGKRSIASHVLQEDVDLVASDFSGASWRRKSGPDQQFDSTLESALKIARLLVQPGSSPLWGSTRIPSKSCKS